MPALLTSTSSPPTARAPSFAAAATDSLGGHVDLHPLRAQFLGRPPAPLRVAGTEPHVVAGVHQPPGRLEAEALVAAGDQCRCHAVDDAAVRGVPVGPLPGPRGPAPRHPAAVRGRRWAAMVDRGDFARTAARLAGAVQPSPSASPRATGARAVSAGRRSPCWPALGRLPRPAGAGPRGSSLGAGRRLAGPGAAAVGPRTRPASPRRRPPAPLPTTVPTHIPGSVQRLLARLPDVAIGVWTAHWTLLTANPAWEALLGPMRPGVNLVLAQFAGVAPEVVWDAGDHERHERALVSDLRTALIRYPDDPSVRAVLAELQAYERFRQLWAEGTVVEHRFQSKTFVHPLVGEVTLDCDVLTAIGTDLRIVAYTAEPGTEDASRFDLIRTVGMTEVGGPQR